MPLGGILIGVAPMLRKLTLAEYNRLVDAEILGPVELRDGRVVIGAFDLAFSDAQIAAAHQVGVDLRASDPIDGLRGTLDQRSYPPGYLQREREGWRE